MKLTTTRSRILEVPKRFVMMYQEPHASKFWDMHKHKLKELQQLDMETADASQIDAIMGNKSWTRITCTECKKDCHAAIVFEGYIEEHVVCKECVIKAYKLLNK